MAKLKLTQSRVNEATCPSDKKRADWFDTDCKGLVLEARITGGKTFHLRYQDSRGRTRQMSLADANDVTLSQARSLADKARNQIAMGEDPKEQRATAKALPTFAAFIEERYLPYVKGYKKSWDQPRSPGQALESHRLRRTLGIFPLRTGLVGLLTNYALSREIC